MTGDMSYRSAADVAASIREGKLSAVDVIDGCLDRIDARNDATNAFCTVASEHRRSTTLWQRASAAFECERPWHDAYPPR